VNHRRTLYPITILAGFLGAGKTTLLRSALEGPNAGSVAVVINEFGSIGLDHEFVLDAGEAAPVVVAGGCACCTRREELAAALRRLLDEVDNGRRPRPTRVVIETSGLADPAPIAFTIASDPVLQHHFRVAEIVTAVDARAGVAQLNAYPEALKQVEVADRVILTKLDVALPAAAAELEARIRQLNPVVDVEPAGRRTLLPMPGRSGPAARLISAVGDRRQGAPHTDGIQSLSLELDQPVDWVAFGVWLTMLLHRHGERVLRVKGIVDAEGFGPVFINSVQHVISPPEHAGDGHPRRPARLVFILRNLSPVAVADSFRSFQAAV
jgi:G3E family GTPase